MSMQPTRKPTRAPGYNYRRPGSYFVTIIEYRRLPRFGRIVDGRQTLNAAGEMVLATWNERPKHFYIESLDICVLMPNHFRAILTLPSENNGTNSSLSDV